MSEFGERGGPVPAGAEPMPGRETAIDTALYASVVGAAGAVASVFVGSLILPVAGILVGGVAGFLVGRQRERAQLQHRSS